MCPFYRLHVKVKVTYQICSICESVRWPNTERRPSSRPFTLQESRVLPANSFMTQPSPPPFLSHRREHDQWLLTFTFPNSGILRISKRTTLPIAKSGQVVFVPTEILCLGPAIIRTFQISAASLKSKSESNGIKWNERSLDFVGTELVRYHTPDNVVALHFVEVSGGTEMKGQAAVGRTLSETSSDTIWTWTALVGLEQSSRATDDLTKFFTNKKIWLICMLTSFLVT